MDKRYFSEKVVEWYVEHKRQLPWRQTKDPYRIWLSEIILQQTRVSQGTPYYLRFIETFPKVGDLAKATERQVLRLWQGLGYYTRARNLHKCARVVVTSYNGKFPATFQDLKTLPGIGDYTAAAIASIAYKEPVGVVDGNVFRVLARYFGIEKDVGKPEGKKHFFQLANELIQNQQPDVYNQAVMEFGAMICTPKSPDCNACVLASRCFARKNNLQSVFPIKEKVIKIRKRYLYYLVIRQGKQVYMQKREQADIWRGLYDFPLIEKTKPLSPANLSKELTEVAKIGAVVSTSSVYRHILSHQVLLARFVVLESTRRNVAAFKGKFYRLPQIVKLPKPVLISKFLSDNNLL